MPPQLDPSASCHLRLVDGRSDSGYLDRNDFFRIQRTLAADTHRIHTLELSGDVSLLVTVFNHSVLQRGTEPGSGEWDADAHCVVRRCMPSGNHLFVHVVETVFCFDVIDYLHQRIHQQNRHLYTLSDVRKNAEERVLADSPLIRILRSVLLMLRGKENVWGVMPR